MASYHQWKKLLVTIIFYFVSLCPISEISCVSYPLNHKGLLPAGKTLGKVGSALGHVERSPKKGKKKALSVSKNLFQKLISNQEEMEKEADREAAETVYPIAVKDNESRQKQIKNPPSSFDIPRSFPKPIKKYNTTDLDGNVNQINDNHNKNFVYKPYYDCPLFSNDINGKAIIKPDPFDCGCCYYCNWGIHQVQCCSWPLLWNDDIKSCDWYWKVFCYTTDYWKKK